MKKTKMLKKNYEFRRVLSKGTYFSGIYIQSVVLKNKKSYNSLGLAISTKLGKAVKRNRIKRLLRENYKILEENIKDGYDIVFLVKKKVNIDELDFKNINQDMKKILKKAEVIMNLE